MGAGTRFYFALVALVVVERLFELYLSARNARRVAARCAVEGESRAFYGAIVLFHTLFLAAGPLEVILLDRPFVPPLAIAATAVVVLAMALRSHYALGCRGATRVDMIVSDSGNEFVLEVNTVPGLTPTSLLPKIADAAGISFG